MGLLKSLCITRQTETVAAIPLFVTRAEASRPSRMCLKEPDKRNLHKDTIHLTNYSLILGQPNMHIPAYLKSIQYYVLRLGKLSKCCILILSLFGASCERGGQKAFAMPPAPKEQTLREVCSKRRPLFWTAGEQADLATQRNSCCQCEHFSGSEQQQSNTWRSP